MWPFSSAYPEQLAEDVDGKTFDYIIVGGGCAGCVLASRLSEDEGVSVLVVEKGRVRDNWLSRVPLLSQNFKFPYLQAVSRLSQPIPGAAGGGRRARLWGAEGVGGASRINGMLLTRGVPAGFDQWARDLGLDDWAWDRVEPYFRRSERAVGHPGAPHRGHAGPVENRQPARSGLLGSFPYYERAAAAVGLPACADLNDPAAPAQGYFYLDMTIDARGYRLSAYRAWLAADVAHARRDRLAVCTGAIASRLEVDGRRVTGVHIRHAQDSEESGRRKDFFVKARREVIVCSGAICTPQLLMLSGIGPRDGLEKNGVPLVHELPNVGRNLSDHSSVPIMNEMPRKDTLHQLESLAGILWHLLLYLLLGTGLLASSSTPASIFVRTTAVDDETMMVRHEDASSSNDEKDKHDNMDASDPRNIPDVEIMLNPVNCLVAPVPGRYLGCFYTTLVQPLSRGRVELSSADPRAHPRIEYPMLTDTRDAAVLRKATRFAMHLADQFEHSGYPHPAPLVIGPGMDLGYLDWLYEQEGSDPALTGRPDGQDGQNQRGKQEGEKQKLESWNTKPLKRLDWRSVTDEEIDTYASRVWLTSLHFSSTCRMSLGPEGGVVDQRLRVHGMSNLRVADASVFPQIPSAHTMAPTIMVAERCADFIKAEHAEKKDK